jgi:molybdenum cofactor biosynthesis enzyme MoaA
MDTIYRLIKLNRLLPGHRMKFAGILCADLLGLRHLFVRIDPVIACNLHCLMCHFSTPEEVAGRGMSFSRDEIERIAEIFFKKTVQLVIGCGAEPTMYKHLAYLLELGRHYRVPYIGIATNGQSLTEELMRTFVAQSLDELVLSIHGITPATYERFMPPARFQKLIEVLTRLDALRGGLYSAKPSLRINYTVNPDNLGELADFFTVFGMFKIRTLQIRPIVDLGTTVYQNKDLSPLLAAYQNVITRLGEECRERNIIFLATRKDPTYRDRNDTSVALEYVKRNISPLCVWRPDFRWREESCRDYCRRIGWRRRLFKGIFSASGRLPTRDTLLTYDVDI